MWLTRRAPDDDEIALRRWRGRTEIVAIEALEPEQPYFGTFRVQSGSGGFYEVEIRDLGSFNNSCGCIDHRANGLVGLPAPMRLVRVAARVLS